MWFRFAVFYSSLIPILLSASPSPAFEASLDCTLYSKGCTTKISSLSNPEVLAENWFKVPVMFTTWTLNDSMTQWTKRFSYSLWLFYNCNNGLLGRGESADDFSVSEPYSVFNNNGDPLVGMSNFYQYDLWSFACNR